MRIRLPRIRPLAPLAKWRCVDYAVATALVGVLLWGIFNPLRWWFPRDDRDRERSPGTTTGYNDAPRTVPGSDAYEILPVMLVGPVASDDATEPCCAIYPGDCPPDVLDCSMCMDSWNEDQRQIACVLDRCIDACWDEYPDDPVGRQLCWADCWARQARQFDCALAWWCYCTGQCPAIPLCVPPGDRCE